MIIDGKQLAEQLNQQTQERAAKLGFSPILCDVVVGADPVSLSYVGIKQRTAEKFGLKFMLKQLPADASTGQVIAAINETQSIAGLHGLIVQMPLPQGLPAAEILSSIEPRVDVDLLNPDSAKKFYVGQSQLTPPTAAAILHILNSLDLELKDLSFVVVGQGDLVGKPVTYLLKQHGYKVDVVDIDTPNRELLLANADVVISGVGKPKLISGDMVKEGVIIIDAGTSDVGGSISGDIDFESVEPKARFITPVPGGVGPVTVAKLLENVVIVAESNP